MRAVVRGVTIALCLAMPLQADDSLASLEARLSSVAGAERVDVLVKLAEAHRPTSVDESAKAAGEALTLARSLRDRRREAEALRVMAEAHLGGQELERALGEILEARKLTEAGGHVAETALSEITIGRVYTALRQPENARPAFERALELATRVGDRAAQGDAEVGLGNMDFVSQQPAKALTHYETAADLARSTGRRGALAAALDSIGLVHRVEGRLEAGRASHLEALALREELADAVAIGRSLGNLGHVEVEMGRYADAEAHLLRAVEIGKGTRSATLQDALEILTTLRQKQGRYREALDTYTQHVAERERHLNEKAIRAAAAERARYDADRREIELRALSVSNELLARKSEIERLRTRMLALVLALVGFVAILLLQRYRHLLAFWKRRSYVGSYRLLGPLGAGGMGEVFEAAHIRDTTKRVAVKLLRQQYTNDPVLRQRFKNEAILIDQLEHPHIVKVFERGEHDQRLYIVMELIEGPTLAEVIRSGTTLPLAECVAVMEQLVQTLARIHAMGIVHRDLKPENVMLSTSGATNPFVKLLDFDIAKSHSLTRLTETGEILGTVSYLAPEQITSQSSSPASDIHALGVVFYEMLTLERPFLGQAPLDIVRQILEVQPIPPATLRPEIPPR